MLVGLKVTCLLDVYTALIDIILYCGGHLAKSSFVVLSGGQSGIQAVVHDRLAKVRQAVGGDVNVWIG